MGKLLIPLGLVVVGVAVWLALAPADESPVDRPQAAVATPDGPNEANDEDEEPTVVDKAVVAEGKTTRRPPVVNGLPDREKPAMDPTTGRPVGETDFRPVSPSGKRYGRRHDQPMKSLNLVAVKDSVRQFYGNLPASGKVPAKITLADLFTDDVIVALNYPPGSRVKELGHYPIENLKGFKELLASPDDAQLPLGVTVVTPDGQELRDYLMLAP